MSALSISMYVLALATVLIGFIGLVGLVGGFVEKAPKKVKMGTIMVCISLGLMVSGLFCVSAHCLKKAKARHQMEMKCRMGMERECMEKSDCCPEGDMKGDSNDVKVCKKITVEEKCLQKCDPKTCDKKDCKHGK